MLADERRRVAVGRPRLLGPAPVGVVAERPARPRSARGRARATRSRRSAGGRISAAISKPPGRARLQRGERRQTRRRAGARRGRRRQRPSMQYADVHVRDLRTARPSGAPNPALVERMNAALVHRGPDEGASTRFGRCVLGHRRLQVIDLDTGSQPVANETGDVVAVFNGELYNFHELRDELRGHEVRGTGDTPVIPHLYEEHGVGFVERLGGMFALALWDARPRAARARPRPRRQEAAALDAPARRDARVRLGAEGAAAPAAASRARSTRRRSTPTSRCSTCPARHGAARDREAAARATCSSPRAGRSGRAVLAARARGPSAYEGDWLELVRDDGRRRRAQAPRRRRAARRAALRRDRLERRRRADGRRRRAAGAHVHRRVRGRPLRRARVRARGRRALRRRSTRRS